MSTISPDAFIAPEHPADDEAWLAWANGLPLFVGLGLVCTSITEETAEFTLASAPISPNPNGSVNGGLMAAIADQAMGALSVRGAPSGYYPSTASLHTQYFSPAMAPLTLRARAYGGGRRVRFIEVMTYDRDGVLCAGSQGTMVMGPPRTPR